MNMVAGLDASEGRQLHALIISKETVKPSSPAPSHLKTYNLSMLDQFSPPIYIPFVFFYLSCGGSSSHQEKSAQLKKSLSETLAQYYPFSGRIADGYHVDCNDEGVEFVEAQINFPLSQLLHRLHLMYEPLDQLFPANGVWGNANKASCALVRVQLSYFACGGLALAVSVSHRIADACTLFAFLNHWAALTQRNSGEESQQVLPMPPHFISSPKSEAAFDLDLEYLLKINKGNNLVTQKFVFPNRKLDQQLKAKVKHQAAGRVAEIAAVNPTGIEVLTSLLYGCGVRAAKASSSDYSAKISVFVQAMNMRNRMNKPLPETATGNIISIFTIPTMSESEFALDLLTTRIKKAKMQLTGKTESQVNQWVAEASKKLITSYRVASFGCTSMCKFPLYKVDFGWGKPIRVSVAEPPRKDLFLITSEDGIEVLLTLEDQIMATFQNDEQLLAFDM